ncbi:hypothetical protein [Streptosporangium sp. NPDC023615]|uniref:hypothetical protein n=1 Tax=Streptosporangium sp. NPDC023615 TaxID=3154794 RepID=UPI00342B1083
MTSSLPTTRRSSVAVAVAGCSSNERSTKATKDICPKVIEEKAGGKLATADRPGLLTALSCIREGDLPTVQEADRLGRNLLEGLIGLPEPA